MYKQTVTLRGVAFDTAVDKTLAALKSEGFGLLRDIDLQATMKAKMNVERPPYRILGVCNPPLAHRAVEAEPDIGIFLPCNVAVRAESDGTVVVVFMNTDAVMGLVDNDDIKQLGRDVNARLARARQSLAAELGGETA